MILTAMKIIALAVQSLDGLIARSGHELINWSSPEDKQMFAKVTKQAGVVIMGKNTFVTFKKPLPDRLNVVLTSQPASFESIPNQAEFKNSDPKSIIWELSERGFKKVFIIGGQATYTEFLQAGLINELWITIEPIVFGQGLTLFSELSNKVNLKLVKAEKLNANSIHLRYKVKYRRELSFLRTQESN